MRKVFLIILLLISLSFGLHGLAYNSSTHYQVPNSCRYYTIKTNETVSLTILTNNSHSYQICINHNYTTLMGNRAITLRNLSGTIVIKTFRGAFLLKVTINKSLLLKDLYMALGFSFTAVIGIPLMYSYFRGRPKSYSSK